jgi:hypothetical protein
MWPNLFGTENYEGSKLEQLVLTQRKRLEHVDQAQIASFAKAMLDERPTVLAQFSLPGGPDFVSKVLSAGLLHLMTIGSKAAHEYGGALKRVRDIDPASATALANCLALYAVMSDLPASQADGGYRKWFGAYLLFRWSMGKAGLIIPWQKMLIDELAGEDKRDARELLLAFFGDDLSNKATHLLPTGEAEHFVLYAKSIAAFDPTQPSQWNKISSALSRPDHAVEGLLAALLAPALDRLAPRRQSGSSTTGVFPAGDFAKQMAIDGGFTSF